MSFVSLFETKLIADAPNIWLNVALVGIAMSRRFSLTQFANLVPEALTPDRSMQGP
ncbi:MAG: hypothetical protein IN818_01270 [Cutibacterium sp.]|nr:hypothetical protein [Cutibacterium sp.]